jgi:hypothetical protein
MANTFGFLFLAKARQTTWQQDWTGVWYGLVSGMV